MRTHYNPTAIVRIGDLGVPARLTADHDNPEPFAYSLTLEIALDGDQLVCEALTCRRRDGAGPVTGDVLRQVPVARLVTMAAWEAVFVYLDDRQMQPVSMLLADAPDPSDGPTTEALTYVARVYAIAVLCGEGPTRMVADLVGLPQSTAGYWVRKARQQGLLTVSAPRTRKGS